LLVIEVLSRILTIVVVPGARLLMLPLAQRALRVPTGSPS
jgi:hypothetical protein